MILLPHDTWNVLDSTKLDEYERCPRRFFWRYLLGWQPDITSVHLVFGRAWHRAMDILLTHGYSLETIDLAMVAFLECWTADGFHEGYGDGAKTPANARKALELYIRTYSNEHPELDHNQIEVPGVVPICEDGSRKLHLKIDRLTKNEHGLWCIWDHKTAYTVDDLWVRGWELHSQFTTYIFALSCVVPLEQIYGVIVNGMALRTAKTERAKGNEARRVSICKTPSDIEAWLEDTNGVFAEWERNMALLRGETPWKPDPDSLTCLAFRRRPEGCKKYNSLCAYHNLCCAYSNPLDAALRHEGEAPQGMKIEFWDPRKQEVTEVEA